MAWYDSRDLVEVLDKEFTWTMRQTCRFIKVVQEEAAEHMKRTIIQNVLLNGSSKIVDFIFKDKMVDSDQFEDFCWPIGVDEDIMYGWAGIVQRLRHRLFPQTLKWILRLFCYQAIGRSYERQPWDIPKLIHLVQLYSYETLFFPANCLESWDNEDDDPHDDAWIASELREQIQNFKSFRQ